MKISIKIKLDDKKLKKCTPNPIYEYAELIEVLREHGFVHKSPLDFGFINDDAKEEQAKQAIADAFDRLGWLDEDLITEFRVEKIGESFEFSAPFDFKFSEDGEDK